MLKKYLAFAAASMIGLAGVATAAETVAQSNAQEARQIRLAPKKGQLPRDLQDLNLSKKQQAKIQQILDANRPQRADNAQQVQRPDNKAPSEAQRAEFEQRMQAQRAAEQQIISSKHFDEAAARRMVEERQAEFEKNAAERKQRRADMEVRRLKERHDIFQVLTAKQQKQWLENQAKYQPKGKPDGKRPQAAPQK